MKAKLVKFDDDGTQCKRDIEYLRRHPECGIPFIQDKPFKPDNPKHKFRPYDRNFNIDILDRAIPSDPNIPPAQPIGKPPKIGEAVGGPPYANVYLPQDYTNRYDLAGRRILEDTPHGNSVDEYLSAKIVNYFNKSGYGVLPIIGNDTYSHETPERPTRPVGEVELEDFGAGVGIPNEAPPPISQTRIMSDEELMELQIRNVRNKTTLPKPRRPLPEIPNSELIVLDPQVEEAVVIQQAERFIRKGRPEISMREADQIADFFIQKNISRERTMEILKKNNLYDEEFELNLQKIPDPNERASIRRLRAMRIIREQQKASGISQTRTRPLADPRDTEFTEQVRPRGMTDEELMDLQIQQLTRNSTQKEAKQIEQSIRKGKGKAKVKPTEQEMFPIEPIDEELSILKEIEKILKPGEVDLTIRQKENLVREMTSRGVSRQRVEEILNKYEAYDPALERAIGGTSRGTDEEILLRRLRSSIREMPTRDTNLLPERLQEIELREDTPLTRGRTDIAPGRTRIQKVMDKTAGKLPEELRSVYKSTQRNAEAFNENVRTRSLEAIQRVRSTTTRVFGQRYSNIRETALELRGGDIELVAPEGNINIRPPATEEITGLRPGDLQALDFNPLGADYQETFVGETRPTLNYAERLQQTRFEGNPLAYNEVTTFATQTGVAGAGAVGGVLIGFGVAQLMQSKGVDNKYAIAATAGGAGGAGARILTMAGSRALTRGGATAIVDTASTIAIKAGTSLLRGAAEGAVIGLILMPVDEILNRAFINAGMSHTDANLTSGAIVGSTATAATTIGLAALGAAPETLGASLIVGGLALATTSIIGFFTGQDQDRREREAREEAERVRTHLDLTSLVRKKLLQTLPNYGYDFNKALAAFNQKENLGIDDGTWETFSKNSSALFVPRPNNNPPPTPTSGEPPSEEQRKINDLFSKYITHQLIREVCTGGTGCEELKRQDLGELTEDEVNYLNDKTGSTWRGQANMQVEMSVQELNYTRQRMGDAQLEMLNAWNNEKRIANQLDPYIVETASLDPTFRQRYDLAIKLDAEQMVVDAFQDDQTKIEQLPKNVRDTANQDPEFDNMIHKYYDSMETTAGQLAISVPQLIELQSLTGEEQKDKYQEFQFNNIKQDPTVVAEAQEISSEEDQVRQSGFYDIDQAFLETDPTAITTWHPTDSQILQAHSAGMNLNEYVDYMHQLAKGEAGDYRKLSKYNDAELRASGLLDYSHFQDELQLGGYRKDLYLYNEETRNFTLNPNVTNSAIPSTQEKFISRYTPRYLLQARQEYADMVHGLNEKNQSEVDNYNNTLMKELSSYGKHYDRIVSDINNERLYQGRSDLLFYDVGKIFNENRIEFSAISEKLSDAPTNIISQDTAMTRQLGEKASPVTETTAPGVAVTFVPGLVGTDITQSPLPDESV
jgi:hypothetical protein